jgi:rRNA maturation endonuclease Nob1
MLGYVIIFGLVIGACYWIIHPLLREEDLQDNITPQPEDVLEKLKNKKDGVYATIKELEFDLSMGKLSEEDFNILKQQYLQEAAGYMEEMDKLESLKATVEQPDEPDLEDEIELQFTARRPTKSTQRKHIYCTSCGEKAAAESRFCEACGSNLHKQAKKNFQEEN